MVAGFAVLGIGFLFLHYLLMQSVFNNPQMMRDMQKQSTPPPKMFFNIFRWFYAIFGGIAGLADLFQPPCRRLPPATPPPGECAHQAALWLLIEEQPDGTIKFAFGNLPADTSRLQAVRLWRERWKIERGCQQMKEELGLDHYEGRSWRGFHPPATLVMLAFGFLALEALRAKQADLALKTRTSGCATSKHNRNGNDTKQIRQKI